MGAKRATATDDMQEASDPVFVWCFFTRLHPGALAVPASSARVQLGQPRTSWIRGRRAARRQRSEAAKRALRAEGDGNGRRGARGSGWGEERGRGRRLGVYKKGAGSDGACVMRPMEGQAPMIHQWVGAQPRVLRRRAFLARAGAPSAAPAALSALAANATPAPVLTPRWPPTCAPRQVHATCGPGPASTRERRRPRRLRRCGRSHRCFVCLAPSTLPPAAQPQPTPSSLSHKHKLRLLAEQALP